MKPSEERSHLKRFIQLHGVICKLSALISQWRFGCNFCTIYLSVNCVIGRSYNPLVEFKTSISIVLRNSKCAGIEFLYTFKILINCSLKQNCLVL